MLVLSYVIESFFPFLSVCNLFNYLYLIITKISFSPACPRLPLPLFVPPDSFLSLPSFSYSRSSQLSPFLTTHELDSESVCMASHVSKPTLIDS